MHVAIGFFATKQKLKIRLLNVQRLGQYNLPANFFKLEAPSFSFKVLIGVFGKIISIKNLQIFITKLWLLGGQNE